MPAAYDYSSLTGYARARADWKDFPDTSTPVRQVDLDRIDQSLFDIKTCVYNVRDFGATGLGRPTDDTVACQAALNACQTTGGVVYFPLGTYYVQPLLYYSNTIVLGAGWGSVVQMVDNAQRNVGGGRQTAIFCPALSYTDMTTGAVFQDLKLIGNSANQHAGGPTTQPEDTRHGIRLIAANHCTVYRVWAEDFDGDGIYLGRDGHAGGAANLNAYYNLIEDCVVTNNVRNGMMIAAGAYNTIRNCRFTANQVGMNPASPKYAPSMYASAELDIEPNYAGQDAVDNLVESNFFYNGWNIGIQITRPQPRYTKRNVIRGNWFIDNQSINGVNLDTNGGVDNVIENNTFILNDPTLAIQHLRAAAAVGTVIRNNRFLGGGNGTARSIQLDDAGTQPPTGFVFAGNTMDFSANGATGLGLEAGIGESSTGNSSGTIYGNKLYPGSVMQIYDKLAEVPVKKLSYQILYTDANVGVTIGVLPQYVIMKSISLYVSQAFNGGTNNLRLGYSGNTNSILNDTDITTTGLKTTVSNQGPVRADFGSVRTILATYVQTGAAPTTGSATVVLEFYPA